MTRILMFLVAAVSVLVAQDNQLTPAELKAGWQLLFDGRTADRWRGTASETFPSSWTLEDGCLRTVTSPGKIHEDLVSQQSFRDFDLRFEWRLSPGANTGVKYLVQTHIPLSNGHDYAVGFEMQLIDDGGHPDAKVHPNRTTGAFYSHLAPSATTLRPPGEFNSGRVVLKGSHVEHWVNGAKVVEYEIDSSEIVESVAR